LTFWDNQGISEEGWDCHISESWPRAMQVDLLRVLAVNKFGGWYVDADTNPLNKLFPELDKVFLVREDGKRFWNGFFYAPKNHPFLIFWLNEILVSIGEQWPHKGNVSEITGPHALSRALYAYASAVGVDKCREEIVVAPWRFVTFRKQRKHLSFIQDLLRKGSMLEHYGEATWVENHSTKKESFGDSMYLLRQSPLSSILDLFRLVIKNPRKFPKNKTEYKILRNLDNSLLDLKEPWEVHRKRIASHNHLESSMRDLRIGVFIINDPLLSEKLLFAGWEEIEKGEWIRPRVTDLVSKFHAK